MKILRVFLLAFCVFLACANANDTQKWASEITAGKQIPADKFLAFYLNKDDPKTVVFSETVENINLNFAYDKYLPKNLSPIGSGISTSSRMCNR